MQGVTLGQRNITCFVPEGMTSGSSLSYKQSNTYTFTITGSRRRRLQQVSSPTWLPVSHRHHVAHGCIHAVWAVRCSTEQLW